MLNAKIEKQWLATGTEIPASQEKYPGRRSWLTIVALPLLLLVLLGSNALGQMSDKPDAILAIVNEDTIRSTDIDRLLLGAHGQMGAASMQQFDFRKLFDRTVNDRLLVGEARLMELHLEPWLVEEVQQVISNNAVALFAKEKYKPELAIDSTEIEAYFNQYYFRKQLRSISVPLLKEAEALAKAIRNGADMDSLAKEVSVDVHKLKGGLHNFKYYGDIEADLRSIADQLAINELSDPFPYRKVFAVIRWEKEATPDRADLPGLKTKITNVLRYRKNLDARTEFLDRLNQLSPVTIDSAALDGVRQDSLALFTPAFMNGSDVPVLTTTTGQVLTDDQLRKAVSREAMTNRTDPFDSLFTRAFDQALEMMLLKNGARHYGYFENKRVEKIGRQYLDSNLIELYIQQTVVPQIEIDPVEVEAYYDSHLDDFRNPPRYQFDRMIFAEEEPAQQAVERLSQGADFKFVASQLGGEPADAKENAEWLSLSGFPSQVRTQISSLRIGEVTAALATSEGWLILKVKAKQQGELQPLNDVATQIKSIFFAEKFATVMDQTLGLLKANAHLWIDTTAVNDYFGEEAPEVDNEN